MDLPRASTPISLVNIKEFSMLNIPAIFDFDKDDEIGLQPNKKPISTIDKNIKRKNEHLPYKKPTPITAKYKFIEKLTKTTK